VEAAAIADLLAPPPPPPLLPLLPLLLLTSGAASAFLRTVHGEDEGPPDELVTVLEPVDSSTPSVEGEFALAPLLLVLERANEEA
jgi:hypothetical protein